jgi:hypothetical protein
MGYKFQFVTLAGFHSLSYGTFALARDYRERGMAAYTELQQAEFAAERLGYTATRHQREAGTGYFDLVANVVSEGRSSTTALAGSTEAAQFTEADRIASARRAMEEDHRDLETFASHVRIARDVDAMVAALDQLGTFLSAHFQREERDDGILGILGNGGVHGDATALLEEHRQILAEVEALATTVRQGMSPAQGAERAARVEQRLREHERRELKVAEALVGMGARA